MKKFLAFGISTLVILMVSSGQAPRAADTGQSAVPFLTLPGEAREAAMGGAYSAEAQGSHAVWANPAGMARSEARSLTLMHTFYLESLTYSTLAASFPFGDGQAIGFGVGDLSYGSVPSFDSTGQSADSYSPNDLKVRLAYARNIFSFQAGLAATYVRSTIQDSATTEAFDIGLQQSFDALIVAFSVQNIGRSITYLNTPEPLPRFYRLGSSYRVTPNWCVTSDLVYPAAGNTTLAVGTEYSIGVDENKSVAIRAGYNTEDHQGLSGVSGISAGAGFRFGETALNYAWVPFGDLGQTHRLSVDFKLGTHESSGSESRSESTDQPLQERSTKLSTAQQVQKVAALPIFPWKVTRQVNRSSQARLMDLLSHDALCPSSGPKAVITKIQGTVKIRKADQVRWMRARLGQYLFESDVLRTDPASFADLVFLNHVKLRVGGDSDLGIRLGVPICDLARVRLESGAVSADVAEERGLIVETPHGDETLSGLQGTITVDDKEVSMRVTKGSATFTTDGQTIPLREKKVYRKRAGQSGLTSEDDAQAVPLVVDLTPADKKSIVGRWDDPYLQKILAAINRLAFVPDLQTAEYVRETGLRSALQAELAALDQSKMDLTFQKSAFGQDVDNFQNLIETLKVPPPTETPEEKSQRKKNMRDAKASLARAQASFRQINKEFKVVQNDYRFDQEFLASVPIVRMLNITAEDTVIPFSSDQSLLTAQVTPALDAIAEAIRQLSPTRVVVEGHTDKSGSVSVNNRLSKRRADAVVSYLREKADSPSVRFVAKGMGSKNPISKDDSPEQMAKDRRVEIWLELRGL